MGASILTYTKAEAVLRSLKHWDYAQTVKGISFYLDSVPYICYADSLSIVDRRDTILHECAHLFLGHLSDGTILGKCADQKKEDAQEREADEFAVATLAPAHLLRAYGLTSKQDIQRVCRVSEGVALRAAEILSETAPRPGRWRMLALIALIFTTLAVTAIMWALEPPTPQPTPIPPESIQSVLPEVIPPQEPESDTTTYVTKDGDKYYKEDCYQVRSSTLIPMGWVDAEKAGYDPCKTCQPNAT